MTRVEGVKRVAIVGAGPAGAIAVDAFAQEKCFDVIRVFERREKAGGLWILDDEDYKIPSLKDVVECKADGTTETPLTFPCLTDRKKGNDLEGRYAYTPMYPGLISNIEARVMSYSQESFPETDQHGIADPNLPAFRTRHNIRDYIESLLNRRGYPDFIEYNTTVELAEKSDKGEWTLTLRKSLPGGQHDYWWQETFDALVVASGHYNIPQIPGDIEGLQEFERRNPGRVMHSKQYRGPEKYRGKTVVTVGASISAMDMARGVIGSAKSIYAAVRTPHKLFGLTAFDHPGIVVKPPILAVSADGTVYFGDGSKVDNVDYLMFGTGYVTTLPYLPSVKVNKHRVLGAYLHTFYREDPTLVFIGFIAGGFTFRAYEWQSVAAARVLAGRTQLPSYEEQEQWEKDRLQTIGDNRRYIEIGPDYQGFFEALRALAREPKKNGAGRRLPEFDAEWLQIFIDTNQQKLEGWKTAKAHVEVSKPRL